MKTLILLQVILFVLFEANILAEARAEFPYRQATRKGIVRQFRQDRMLKRQSIASSQVYPTCAESPLASGTPYAQYSDKAGYYNDTDYFIFPSVPSSSAADCAAQCQANQECFASTLLDGQCFLYKKTPSSVRDMSGYTALIRGGCAAYNTASVDPTCCNIYV